jgi:hypothetical protein
MKMWYYDSGISHIDKIPRRKNDMSIAIKEYDAKIDSKKRVTLRNTSFEYYHVQEMDNGVIILEPRELTVPFQVSANTLSMMDESVKNLKKGKVSAAIDLSAFKG